VVSRRPSAAENVPRVLLPPTLASMQSSTLPPRSTPLAFVHVEPVVLVSESRAITIASSPDFPRGSLLLLAKEGVAFPLQDKMRSKGVNHFQRRNLGKPESSHRSGFPSARWVLLVTMVSEDDLSGILRRVSHRLKFSRTTRLLVS
jgi:hypothetical protein